MKIVIVEDTLKDAESLKKVLTKENLQEYMKNYDDVLDQKWIMIDHIHIHL